MVPFAEHRRTRIKPKKKKNIFPDIHIYIFPSCCYPKPFEKSSLISHVPEPTQNSIISITRWVLRLRWGSRSWFLCAATSSLPYPVPPGIRIKCVVHTGAIKVRPRRRSGGQATPRRLLRGRSSVAVSGPELRGMISNRIARNIIRYVFHYRPTLCFGIQIRLPSG